MSDLNRIELYTAIVCGVSGTAAYLSLVPAMFPTQWRRFVSYMTQEDLERRGEALAIPQHTKRDDLLDEQAFGGDSLPFFADRASGASSAIDPITESQVAFPPANLIHADNSGRSLSEAAQILSSKEVR